MSKGRQRVICLRSQSYTHCGLDPKRPDSDRQTKKMRDRNFSRETVQDGCKLKNVFGENLCRSQKKVGRTRVRKDEVLLKKKGKRIAFCCFRTEYTPSPPPPPPLPPPPTPPLPLQPPGSKCWYPLTPSLRQPVKFPG